MNKHVRRTFGLIIVLALLTTPPAFARSPMDVQDSTLFPRTGDTVVLDYSPHWWNEDDYAEGWRTFPDLPEIGQLQYDLRIDNNLLNNGGHCSFRLLVNNHSVGEFTVFEGDVSKHVTYSFAPIAGPNYKLTLDLLNTVEPGKGSIEIPMDQSTLHLFPPVFPCPAAAALELTNGTDQLDLLRKFRDDMLASDPAMQARVDAYYRHAPEATRTLTSHPQLLARTASVLIRSMPAVQALLDGQASEMTVPTRDLQAAYRLLDDLTALASPEFADALQELRALIEAFENHTVAEGWKAITAQ